MKSSDIVIRRDRKISIFLCALVLVAALGRLLCSEVLNLVMTYPSPSGIYNQIVTTGDSGTSPADTTLNRNAGNTILVPSSNVAGKVGIGTTSPAQKLEVAGDVKAESGRFTAGVQLGDDPLTCASEKAGALRWHSGKFEVCDGAAWKPLGDESKVDPKAKCVAGGGFWESILWACRFPLSKCPKGYTPTKYTETASNFCRYCNDGSKACRYSPSGASGCTTGSHPFSAREREFCGPNEFCVATVVQIACVPTP